MHEYAHGELKRSASGKGGKVTSRKQAIAIALHEAGASKYESADKNAENEKKTETKEAQGRTAQQETEGKSHAGASGRPESSPAMGGETRRPCVGPAARAARRRRANPPAAKRPRANPHARAPVNRPAQRRNARRRQTHALHAQAHDSPQDHQVAVRCYSQSSRYSTCPCKPERKVRTFPPRVSKTNAALVVFRIDGEPVVVAVVGIRTRLRVFAVGRPDFPFGRADANSLRRSNALVADVDARDVAFGHHVRHTESRLSVRSYNIATLFAAVVAVIFRVKLYAQSLPGLGERHPEMDRLQSIERRHACCLRRRCSAQRKSENRRPSQATHGRRLINPVPRGSSVPSRADPRCVPLLRQAHGAKARESHGEGISYSRRAKFVAGDTRG